MEIDEKQYKFDLTDHNLMEIHLNIGNEKRKCNRKTWITREYYKTDKKSLEKYSMKLKDSITAQKVNNMKDLESRIIKTANVHLKKTYRRKNIGDIELEEEPDWFTEELRQEIKERKRINRENRNEKCAEKKAKGKIEYLKQKEKVQMLIKKEMRISEEKKAKEIKEDNSNGKNTWKYIKMLRGDKEKKKESLLDNVYGNNDKKLNREDAKSQVKTFWEGVYGKHDNNINNVWNDATREDYVNQREQVKLEIAMGRQYKIKNHRPRGDGRDNVNIPEHLEACGSNIREHIQMALEVGDGESYLEDEIITEERVKKCLMKLKNKKAAGPDGIKPELFKIFLENEVLLTALVDILQHTLDTGDLPEGWKESATVMIPKTSKPKANDYRPIALTNIGYKIFMAVIRMAIEEHIKQNDWVKENQAGFTTGSRIENNILILRHCVHQTYQNKRIRILIE